jgi:hypothetical protein
MTKGFPWTPAGDDKLKSKAIAGHSACEIADAFHRKDCAFPCPILPTRPQRYLSGSRLAIADSQGIASTGGSSLCG